MLESNVRKVFINLRACLRSILCTLRCFALRTLRVRSWDRFKLSATRSGCNQMTLKKIVSHSEAKGITFLAGLRVLFTSWFLAFFGCFLRVKRDCRHHCNYSSLPCVDRLAGYSRHVTFFLALLSCLPPLKELLLATEASWSSGDWSEST